MQVEHWGKLRKRPGPICPWQPSGHLQQKSVWNIVQTNHSFQKQWWQLQIQQTSMMSPHRVFEIGTYTNDSTIFHCTFPNTFNCFTVLCMHAFVFVFIFVLRNISICESKNGDSAIFHFCQHFYFFYISLYVCICICTFKQMFLWEEEVRATARLGTWVCSDMCRCLYFPCSASDML